MLFRSRMRIGPRAGLGAIVDWGSCRRRLATTVAGVITRVRRLVPMQIWSGVDGASSSDIAFPSRARAVSCPGLVVCPPDRTSRSRARVMPTYRSRRCSASCFVGLGYRFSPEIKTEVGYMNQYIQTHSAANDRINHILSVWLFIDLYKK